LHNASNGGGYRRFQNTQQPVWQTRRFWYFAGAAGAGGIVYYQAHLEEAPITGRKRFINVSPQQERQIAQQAYMQTLAEYRGQLVPRGSPVDVYVRRVAERLIRATEITDVDWEIHVINSPERNAFVLPGGKVFVFTGILPITANEDGLATVLGHEIAHQFARHSAEKLSQANLLSVLYLLASFFVDPSMLQLSRAMANVLSVLPNSRACESEADHLGLLFMSMACYDPQEAVGLWQRMKNAEKGAPLQFLNTHPSTESRIDNIRSWIPEAEMKRESADCPVEAADAFYSLFRH
ncbi:metalloendopeptidase, partial [Dipsacomyces acuminosporus]